jgi:hypothetical protein
VITIAIVNGRETSHVLETLDGYITSQKEPLFRSLGDAIVANVQRRIKSQDGGRWTKASKWLRAKSGQSKVLLGAEKYVRSRVSPRRLEIVGKGGKWTLDMHHQGFENALLDPNEPQDDHGRVILRLRDPRPLGLKAKTFAFVPHRAGHTPARKIWPNHEEADRLIAPLASRWLAMLAKEAGA